MRTAAWIVGGGAVVAAGAGLALQLAALSTDDPDKWSTYRRWSIVGYVAGGALAVTSAILFWTSRPASPPVNSRAYFQCTPGLTGIGCQGVF
jgi:hypothetical protein